MDYGSRIKIKGNKETTEKIRKRIMHNTLDSADIYSMAREKGFKEIDSDKELTAAQKEHKKRSLIDGITRAMRRI